MKFGNFGSIRLMVSAMLAIFAGGAHMKAQIANWAFAQNGKAKAQDSRQPAPLPAEPPGKNAVVFSRHQDFIPSVAFSPDGKRLASAGDNSVKVTDLETGKELLKLKNSRGMHFFSVAYSPDGRTLVGAQSMLKEKSSRRAGDTTITTLVYHGEVLVWDAQTGQVKTRLNDDNGPAWALAFSPGGKWLAIATGPTPEDKDCKNDCPAFGEITLWETGDWKLIRRLRASSAAIRAVAFSPDGQLIAGGSGLIDGGRGASAEEESRFEVFLWDAQSGDLKQKLPGHIKSITSLAFSPDSGLLASAGYDRNLMIWDCRTYELKKTASDMLLSVEEMQAIADATSAKSGKNPATPVSWLNAISFSRDGKQVIGGSGDSIIRFYDSESAKLVGVLKPPGWPFFNTFAMIYPTTGADSPAPPVYRPTPTIIRGPDVGLLLRMRGRWPLHVGSLNSMALSPDGRTLAVGNSDGKIRLLVMK
jgi:WD40 repeat protein